MKDVMAIIRMNMMNKTKRALSEAGITSLSAKDALGRGKGAGSRSKARKKRGRKKRGR